MRVDVSGCEAGSADIADQTPLSRQSGCRAKECRVPALLNSSAQHAQVGALRKTRNHDPL